MNKYEALTEALKRAAEAAAAVEAAHAEALKAYAAFEAAAEKYNALRPTNARSIHAASNRPDRIF